MYSIKVSVLCSMTCIAHLLARKKYLLLFISKIKKICSSNQCPLNPKSVKSKVGCTVIYLNPKSVKSRVDCTVIYCAM